MIFLAGLFIIALILLAVVADINHGQGMPREEVTQVQNYEYII